MSIGQLKRASLEDLIRAQALLQETHDLLENEAFVFDINHYDNEETGARCYIGAVRGVVGVEPTPDGFEAAGEGDGPELPLALTAMDLIAVQALTPARLEDLYRSSNFYGTGAPGRYVEALGFQDNHRAPEALALLREALTALHNEIEARKQ